MNKKIAKRILHDEESADEGVEDDDWSEEINCRADVDFSDVFRYDVLRRGF